MMLLHGLNFNWTTLILDPNIYVPIPIGFSEQHIILNIFLLDMVFYNDATAWTQFFGPQHLCTHTYRL